MRLRMGTSLAGAPKLRRGSHQPGQGGSPLTEPGWHGGTQRNRRLFWGVGLWGLPRCCVCSTPEPSATRTQSCAPGRSFPQSPRSPPGLLFSAPPPPLTSAGRGPQGACLELHSGTQLWRGNRKGSGGYRGSAAERGPQGRAWAGCEVRGSTEGGTGGPGEPHICILAPTH